MVTSSHNHTDHLDAATLQPLMAANPGLTVVVPRPTRLRRRPAGRGPGAPHPVDRGRL
ncbi:MAG: hypothetical protein R3A10_21380 [Caldilineaceae bacterium]